MLLRYARVYASVLAQTWALLAAVFVITVVAFPQEGTPIPWTRITDPTGVNIDGVALARTSDGVLHVAWRRKDGNKSDLMHTAISPDGRVKGTPSAILAGWNSLSNPPALIVRGSTLQVLFGGIRTTTSSDPYRDGSLYIAAAGAEGTAWKFEPGAHAASTSVYSSPVAAALRPDGSLISAWAISSGLKVHFGLDPRAADQNLQSSCCAYYPGLATDAITGETVLGWSSNATGTIGLFTQTVAPALGKREYVPGSASPDGKDALGIDQRMPIVARIGGGIYVAYCQGYPTCRSVELWHYKANAPMAVTKVSGSRLVNISAGPEGRIWTMWARGSRVYAARSNRAVTRFGPVITVVPPKGTQSIWKVTGEGSPGPLDLFVSVSTLPKSLATWHTQVFPPLSLTAKPETLPAAQGGKVTFTVSDAGDPVSGASVTVAGKTLKTDAQGDAPMEFAKGSKPGALSATATLSGYREASTQITLVTK